MFTTASPMRRTDSPSCLSRNGRLFWRPTSLWRGKDHAPVAQLAEDFARYPNLPRVQSPEVVYRAIRERLDLLTWASETFGYADRFGEATGRYPGLRGGQRVEVGDGHAGLLVRPDVAARFLSETAVARREGTEPGPAGGGAGDARSADGRTATSGVEPRPRPPTRFHGTVTLDAQRVGRDAGKIAEEAVAYLVAIVGARVQVTLDIGAEVDSGIPPSVVRTVTENCRSLRFDSSGFETE